MLVDCPDEVQHIINMLESNNYSGYIVGGSVRDCILGKEPFDWDICTSAKPSDVLKVFNEYKTIITGIKYGTVTVIIEHQQYEITTYRVEKGYSDNRRPDNVEFTDDLLKDLSRRDFTINAMAYNFSNGLIDPFDGLSDLKNKLIVCVGDPKHRFQEDALRILRGVRFATQLEFNIQEQTFDAMYQCRKLLNNISKERLRDEFIKIILSSTPSYGIRLLAKLNIIDIIIPELSLCIDFDQKNPNHDKDVFEHIMAVLDNTENDLVLRLAALLHDIGKPRCFSLDENGIGHCYRHHIIGMEIAENILNRLRFDNNTINNVKILVKEHMSRYDTLSNCNIKKFIRRVGVDNLDKLFKLQVADIRGSKAPHIFDKVIALKNECEKVLNEKHPLTIKDLNINGNDIISLGYKEGREIGILLNYALELVLNNPELNNKEILLQQIKSKQINKENSNG